MYSHVFLVNWIHDLGVVRSMLSHFYHFFQSLRWYDEECLWMNVWMNFLAFYECCLTTNLVQFRHAFSRFCVQVLKIHISLKRNIPDGVLLIVPSLKVWSEHYFCKLVIQKDNRNFQILNFFSKKMFHNLVRISLLECVCCLTYLHTEVKLNGRYGLCLLKIILIW